MTSRYWEGCFAKPWNVIFWKLKVKNHSLWRCNGPTVEGLKHAPMRHILRFENNGNRSWLKIEKRREEVSSLKTPACLIRAAVNIIRASDFSSSSSTEMSFPSSLCLSVFSSLFLFVFSFFGFLLFFFSSCALAYVIWKGEDLSR